jgi:hypothetical protein
MQKKSVAYEMPMKVKINKQTKKINYLLIKKAQLKTPRDMHLQQQEGHYCNLHPDLFPK